MVGSQLSSQMGMNRRCLGNIQLVSGILRRRWGTFGGNNGNTPGVFLVITLTVSIWE